MEYVDLTFLQKKIMKEFYSFDATKVILNKAERNSLWEKTVNRVQDIDFEYYKVICPALYDQINRSYSSGNNIQSAVFSECVYAQTFANIFSLRVFNNCMEDDSFLPNNVRLLLSSYHLTPRYSYSTDDKKRILIQAGGCGGIDSALITVFDLSIYTIEFKEPYSKTSEADLPKYGEDGKLVITKDFSERYPQFTCMLKEQVGLNFFDVIGNNIHNFSDESVCIAVENNYVKKYADVVCTEDYHGNLVMLPINQISLWAKIEGEIRPAGRNNYNVWTPLALKWFLKNKGAIFHQNIVTINVNKLVPRTARGGGGKISGYKINSLFYVYLKDCEINNGSISFDIKRVRQLNPTIAAKMNFGGLDYNEVRDWYIRDLIV